MKFRSLLLYSTIVRILLIWYGDWQDDHMEVRYTDVDYIVFSDAAASMASGESPYARSTYRYSPLLAFLLLPNSFVHPSWGKLLFSASDLLVAYLIRAILRFHGITDNVCNRSILVWLFNPFTLTIGTRGNCEPVSCALVLLTILFLLKGKVVQSAIWYGLVVHFRIYPIIYALPIVVFLHYRSGKDFRCSMRSGNHWSIISGASSDGFIFGMVSGIVFFICTAISFLLYGHKFLEEAILYHVTRKDPRHNFSIYFYHIYINLGERFSVAEKMFSLLPQICVQLVLIFCFARDVFFCFFIQTLAFVAFNKVVTAQYFVWFFCLLPLILPWNNMYLKWEGILCIIVWTGAQAHWLIWGYLLEFRGVNVFVQLWVASMLFLAANTFVMVMIIRRQRSVIYVRNSRSQKAGVDCGETSNNSVCS